MFLFPIQVLNQLLRQKNKINERLKNLYHILHWYWRIKPLNEGNFWRLNLRIRFTLPDIGSIEWLSSCLRAEPQLQSLSPGNSLEEPRLCFSIKWFPNLTGLKPQRHIACSFNVRRRAAETLLYISVCLWDPDWRNNHSLKLCWLPLQKDKTGLWKFLFLAVTRSTPKVKHTTFNLNPAVRTNKMALPGNIAQRRRMDIGEQKL